jgi:A/G-specific adenine glycosylase
VARSFAARVIRWQRTHGRHDLPWQNTRDPYRIWVSEIMLQQTQVGTVLPYYRRFLASFPDVAALARAPLDDVLAHWSGLGYYRRAHHLHAAARAIVEAHGGEFPRDAATLAALPGIGRSTAAAIAAFAAGAREAILDGNVKRVLARHRGIDGWPGAPKVEAALWEVAGKLLPKDAIEA